MKIQRKSERNVSENIQKRGQENWRRKIERKRKLKETETKYLRKDKKTVEKE